MRTPLTYYGGKQRLASQIVPLMPAHRVYLKPFAGGAAVLFAKPRADRETLNDLNGQIRRFWRALRDSPEDLACSIRWHCLDRSKEGGSMTQCDRVARLLRQRGATGLNTVDLQAPACDGGKPILRLAARIRDLQDAGWRIRSERKLNGTATYFLVSEPDRAAGVDTRIGSPSSQAVAPPGASPLGAREPLPPAEAGLFDSTEFVTRRGSYKDAA